MLILLLFLSVAHGCVIDPVNTHGYSMRSLGCHHIGNEDMLISTQERPSTPQDCANVCTSLEDCLSFTWDYGCYTGVDCISSPYYRCDTTLFQRCYLFTSEQCGENDPGEFTIVYEKVSPQTVDNPRMEPGETPSLFSMFTIGTDRYFECTSLIPGNAKLVSPNTIEQCAKECLNDKDNCVGFTFDVQNRDIIPDASNGVVDYKTGERCNLVSSCSTIIESTRNMLYLVNETLADGYCSRNSDCLSGVCVNGYCRDPQFTSAVKISTRDEKCNQLDSKTLFTCGQGDLICNEWSSTCIQFGKHPGETCNEDKECFGDATACSTNKEGVKTCGGTSQTKNNVFNYFY